jgi:hypothetical protein
MLYLARKGAMAHSFYVTFYCIVLLLLVFAGKTAFANPTINLIRHAAVDLQTPGWGTSKNSAQYKEAYNIAGIEAFNPDKVLRKIENQEKLDTVFCSPQHRALETAWMLFGENRLLKTDSVLAELDYPVLLVPVLQRLEW